MLGLSPSGFLVLLPALTSQQSCLLALSFRLLGMQYTPHLFLFHSCGHAFHGLTIETFQAHWFKLSWPPGILSDSAYIEAGDIFIFQGVCVSSECAVQDHTLTFAEIQEMHFMRIKIVKSLAIWVSCQNCPYKLLI